MTTGSIAIEMQDGFEGLPKTKQKAIQKLITKVEGKR
jgi:hypothetical protein